MYHYYAGTEQLKVSQLFILKLNVQTMFIQKIVISSSNLGSTERDMDTDTGTNTDMGHDISKK